MSISLPEPVVNDLEDVTYSDISQAALATCFTTLSKIFFLLKTRKQNGNSPQPGETKMRLELSSSSLNVCVTLSEGLKLHYLKSRDSKSSTEQKRQWERNMAKSQTFGNLSQHPWILVFLSVWWRGWSNFPQGFLLAL